MTTTERSWDTWDGFRDGLDSLSSFVGEWQGIPVPIEDMPVTLQQRHPLRGFFETKVEPEPEDSGGKVVNHWFSRKLNAEVYVLRKDGRSTVLKFPQVPDRSMDRLSFWLRTMAAHLAWSLDAEYTAREKLCGLLSDHQWRQYDLTGVFLETSPRSKVTYMFRRLRPTVALSPRWADPSIDSMRCLAVLCLHPVGYYADTWAGCMTPSDDVIAHLLMVRADEPGYWAHANQHEPSSPEAGL